MRREHNPGKQWKLVVNCPLNNSLSDISGYNNHLVAVSGGTPVFVNDPTNSNIKVGQYNADSQGVQLNTLTAIN